VKKSIFGVIGIALGFSAGWAFAEEDAGAVADEVIAAERAELASSAATAGFGPQSPRDINNRVGHNRLVSGRAPERQMMNLCNIHLHESAEHKGGEFTTFVGNGDGQGYGSGFKYDGELTVAELAPLTDPVGKNERGELLPGDTIEIHFVYSSAAVKPGATLNACLSEAIKNPQVRVEAIVAVLVNDKAAVSLTQIAKIEQIDGFYQAPNLPEGLGQPVSYAGSTTGPTFSVKASPFAATWNVRPKVLKLDINSVSDWFSDNPFNENHAHGVRNLVINPKLLSPIN
jgi:hypothetical protein